MICAGMSPRSFAFFRYLAWRAAANARFRSSLSLAVAVRMFPGCPTIMATLRYRVTISSHQLHRNAIVNHRPMCGISQLPCNDISGMPFANLLFESKLIAWPSAVRVPPDAAPEPRRGRPVAFAQRTRSPVEGIGRRARVDIGAVGQVGATPDPAGAAAGAAAPCGDVLAPGGRERRGGMPLRECVADRVADGEGCFAVDRPLWAVRCALGRHRAAQRPKIALTSIWGLPWA